MKFETLAIHAGYSPDPVTKSVAVPIYQTVAYAFDNAQHGADLFDLKVPGNIYTRIMNPTNDVLEKRVAALEGGVGALALASGMTAVSYAIQTITEVGDNIIASSTLYGGSYNLFAHTFPQYGIEVRFADPRLPDDFSARIDSRTKAIFCESVGNPLGNVTDIEKLANIAHAHGIPLIVDNTFATPINCRPFEWGADIVTHSTTKYMDGHAMAVGGCIVDSGNFDWDAHKEKFPGLTTPDPTYHGIIYTERFGKLAYITKATSQLMRDLGSVPSPMNSFLLNVGLETLPLRVEKHCSNAKAVAEFLHAHEKVDFVNFAGLEDDPYYELAQKYMPNGTCGVISFGLKGGREAAVRFMDSLKLAAIVTHVADARTCVLHPASHTHRQMTDEQLLEAGVTPGMIRLSVGIENPQDIIEDLEQALRQA